MNKWKKIIIILFFPIVVFAQEYPYINYTTHNGLPQIQVQKLYQDKKGYIWVGTKGGLAQFNGEKFKHYLNNRYIYDIKETLSETMYILTLDTLFRKYRDQMIPIDKVPGRVGLQAGETQVWIISNKTIKEYRQDTLYHVVKSEKDAVFTSGVYDKESDLLVFTTFDKQNSIIYALKDRRLKKIKTINLATTVNAFSNGKVYCQTYKKNKEYKIYDFKTNEVYFSYRMNDELQFCDFRINKIPVKQHLIPNYSPSVYKFYLIDSITNSCKEVQLPLDEEVYPFLIDQDKNYWLGTDNGLYQMNNKSFRRFPRKFMNDFWTLVKGKDGKIYGGKYKSGLYKLDLKNQEKHKIKVKGTTSPIERDYYYGASKDALGNLYFPTHYGLVKYDYVRGKKFPTGVSLISKYDSFSDKIIFGQEFGIGFIDENEHIETYCDTTKKLIDFHPSSLELKANGDIFIGNRRGICLFNKKKKKIESLALYYKNFPKEGIISMTKDYKGNIWLGGHSQLWLYEAANDQFRCVDTIFINTGILSLIAPNPNLLLIGTSYEIYAMKLNDFYAQDSVKFRMFNYRNGFFSEEVAQNGFLQDGNKIYIPSATTTSVMDLEKLSFEPDFFNVLITKVNRISLTNDELYGRKKVEVAKGVNTLDIEFETVGFGLPTKSKFKYKLEGVDKKWKCWSENNKVHYAGLSSGNYTFRVCVRAGSNINSSVMKQKKVDIVVDLPFYQEPHFYKYSLFFLLILVVFMSYITWLFVQSKLKVAHREQKIKFLEIVALQAQINPHFIFNFLSSVQSLISQKSAEEANSYLVKFSRLIRAYMESSIKSSKVLSGSSLANENTIKEEIDLLTAYIDLEKMKYNKGKISYSIEVEDKRLFNKTIPPMILQPFVENAIKHGILPKQGDGWVKILVREEKDALVCVIVDNGIGRQRSKQIQDSSIKAHKSRGLQLIKDRVEMLNQLDYNIKIDFKDPKEGGTIVTIKIKYK